MAQVAAATPPSALAILPTSCGAKQIAAEVMLGFGDVFAPPSDVSGVWRHAPLPNHSHVYRRGSVFVGLPDELLEALGTEDAMFLYLKSDGTSNQWVSTTRLDHVDPEGRYVEGPHTYPVPRNVDKYNSRGYVAKGYMFLWNPSDKISQYAQALQASDPPQVTGQDKDQVPDRVMLFEMNSLAYQEGVLFGTTRFRRTKTPEGEYAFAVDGLPRGASDGSPDYTWDPSQSSWVSPGGWALHVEEGEAGKFKSRYFAEKDVWVVWNPPPLVWKLTCSYEMVDAFDGLHGP